MVRPVNKYDLTDINKLNVNAGYDLVTDVNPVESTIGNTVLDVNHIFQPVQRNDSVSVRAV